MDRIVGQWRERAKYDLETARGMIRIRKYLYAVFMCQQAVEKLLKACLASLGKGAFPIHNLPRLAQEAGLFESCEGQDAGLLLELTPFAIKARYGEYKRKLSELCDRKTAVSYVARTERMAKWLIHQLG